MKNTTIAICTFVLAALLSIHAQKKKLENPFETKGNLNSQFLYLEKTSTNYKEYKVITKTKFLLLHKNVLDSLAIQNNLLKAQRAENKTQLSKINQLNTTAKKLNNELKESNSNRDSITILGMGIYKNNYNLIVGIIILSLITTTLLFYYKFTNSNVITKEAKQQLAETQNEYESHQKKSLKRQQEISRKLQDEILKNRK